MDVVRRERIKGAVYLIIIILIFIAYNKFYYEKLTPLQEAAKTGNLQQVVSLINNGADVNTTTNYDQLPLHLAADNGHLEILSALIDAGSKIKNEDWLGYRPLHLAVKNGYIDIVKELIDHGADVNAKTSGKLGHTSLHIASSAGHLNIIKLLIKNGASLHSRSTLSRTPLHNAVSGGHYNVVKFFMGQGLNPHDTEYNGYSSIKLAKGRHEEIVQLLELGAVGAMPDDSQFKTFTKKDEYSLLIPQAWTLVDDKVARELWSQIGNEFHIKPVVVKQVTFEIPDSEYATNLIIVLDDKIIPINKNELKKYIMSSRKIIKKIGGDIDRINGQLLNRNGVNVFSIMFDIKIDGQNIRQWQLLFPSRGNMIGFTFSTTLNEYNKYKPYINKVFESIIIY